MCFTFLQCFNKGFSFCRKAAIKFLVKLSLIYKLRSVTRNTTKKKLPEAIKQELIASIIEIVDEEVCSGLNKEVKNAREPKEVISVIKKI